MLAYVSQHLARICYVFLKICNCQSGSMVRVTLEELKLPEKLLKLLNQAFIDNRLVVKYQKSFGAKDAINHDMLPN